MMKIRPRYLFQNRKSTDSESCLTYLGLSFGCFLLAMLLSMGWLQNEREALAQRLAPSVLRLHILADSDQKVDQQVKLEIRSLILDYLKGCLNEKADKEETVKYLKEHQQEIEALADEHLKKKGMEYRADLQMVNGYFPTRVYDRYVFPCGYYDAARVILGKGKGHNWWCVLYPQFCFTDVSCQSISEEQALPLSEGLEQDDVSALEDHRPAIEIRFFLLPFLNPGSDRLQSVPHIKPQPAP